MRHQGLPDLDRVDRVDGVQRNLRRRKQEQGEGVHLAKGEDCWLRGRGQGD